jgi:hypothetical protein
MTSASPHIRLDPVTDTDLPHIYRGLSDPRVVAYYGVSYDSLAACRAQMVRQDSWSRSRNDDDRQQCQSNQRTWRQ